MLNKLSLKYTWLGIVLGTALMVSTTYASTIERLTDLGTSARTLAVGNIVGLDTDANALFENPARMHGVLEPRTSLFYTILADQESQYMNVSHVTTFFGFKVGAGLARKTTPSLDYTQLNEFTQRQFSEATFEATEQLFKLGVALPISDQISIGSSFQYYMQSLHTFLGTGMNIDFGATLDLGPFKTSVVAVNFLSSQKVGYNDGIPSADFSSQYVLSTEYMFTEAISILAQVKQVHDYSRPLLSYGIDFSPGLFDDTFHLYAGNNESIISGLKKDRLTGGIGLYVSNMRIQFVYSQTEYAQSGGMYGFSISL